MKEQRSLYAEQPFLGYSQPAELQKILQPVSFQCQFYDSLFFIRLGVSCTLTFNHADQTLTFRNKKKERVAHFDLRFQSLQAYRDPRCGKSFEQIVFYPLSDYMTVNQDIRFAVKAQALQSIYSHFCLLTGGNRSILGVKCGLQNVPEFWLYKPICGPNLLLLLERNVAMGVSTFGFLLVVEDWSVREAKSLNFGKIKEANLGDLRNHMEEFLSDKKGQLLLYYESFGDKTYNEVVVGDYSCDKGWHKTRYLQAGKVRFSSLGQLKELLGIEDEVYLLVREETLQDKFSPK